MSFSHLSRRRFALLTAAVATEHAWKATAQQMSAGKSPTAGELAATILAKTGVAPAQKTVDGFKAGDESTPARGIAVTAMATVDVLRQAAKAGLNMVLTFEPTFFGRSDAQPGAPNPGFGGGRGAVAQDDPILVAKRQFIQSNGMAVYRFHDQWAGRKENELATALAAALGWTRFANPADPTSYEIAAAPLSELVPRVKAQLKVSGGMRVIGDPAARVRRVVLLPGIQPLSAFTSRLPSADLIITGESRDWEGPEYAADAVAAGEKKGLIAVGRVVSEDPGMRACADWIKTFIKDVPVQWIPTGDPYWRPA